MKCHKCINGNMRVSFALAYVARTNYGRVQASGMTRVQPVKLLKCDKCGTKRGI